jgi:hypothetical protein
MPENEDSHPAKDDHILYIKQKVTEEVLDKSRDVYGIWTNCHNHH